MQVVIATIGRCNHLILYLRSTIVIIIWQETMTFRNYWSINNTQQLAQLCNPTAKGSSKVPGLFRFFGACIFVSPVPGPRDWNPTDSLLGTFAKLLRINISLSRTQKNILSRGLPTWHERSSQLKLFTRTFRSITMPENQELEISWSWLCLKILPRMTFPLEITEGSR